MSRPQYPDLACTEHNEDRTGDVWINLVRIRLDVARDLLRSVSTEIDRRRGGTPALLIIERELMLSIAALADETAPPAFPTLTEQGTDEDWRADLP